MLCNDTFVPAQKRSAAAYRKASASRTAYRTDHLAGRYMYGAFPDMISGFL
jgi:hypothetical protein